MYVDLNVICIYLKLLEYSKYKNDNSTLMRTPALVQWTEGNVTRLIFLEAAELCG